MSKRVKVFNISMHAEGGRGKANRAAGRRENTISLLNEILPLLTGWDPD